MCKVCANKARKTWLQKNPEKSCVYNNRYYYKNQEKQIERNRVYYAQNKEREQQKRKKRREANLVLIRLARKAYYQKNRVMLIAKASKRDRMKRNARDRLTSNVRSGKIFRPDYCTICGKKGKPQGHHKDYSRWWDAVWCCSGCHADIEVGRIIV